MKGNVELVVIGVYEPVCLLEIGSLSGPAYFCSSHAFICGTSLRLVGPCILP